MPQLSVHKMEMIDEVVRVRKGSGSYALNIVNQRRASREEQVVHASTIHRYLSGTTRQRGRKEARGRKPELTRKDKLKLEQARKRLLKKADSELRVTHGAIQSEAGLDDVSQRTCERALASGVRFRKPREKIQLSDKDAKERLRVAREWVRHPRTYWADSIRAYVDNKTRGPAWAGWTEFARLGPPTRKP